MISGFTKTSFFHRKCGKRRVARRVAAWVVVAASCIWFLCSSRHAVFAALDDRKSADPVSTTSPPASPVRGSHSQPHTHKSSRTPQVGLLAAVKSKIALVEDANTLEVLLQKNPDKVTPIASITKLMTAIVVLDAKLPLEDTLTIADADSDFVMGTTSRLNVGWSLSRANLLHLALMSSENRAAAALSRYYPGGRPAFIKAMNAKAAELGMTSTHFVNPNGLTPENVSTAIDLAKLVQAAYQYPLIREYSTDPGYTVRIGRHILQFVNSDRLIRSPDWDIEVQKTGFINESGHCVVMRVHADGHDLIMIFLDGAGKLTRFADARRVRLQLALAQKK